jgi:hypothetical protein
MLGSCEARDGGRRASRGGGGEAGEEEVYARAAENSKRPEGDDAARTGSTRQLAKRAAGGIR